MALFTDLLKLNAEIGNALDFIDQVTQNQVVLYVDDRERRRLQEDTTDVVEAFVDETIQNLAGINDNLVMFNVVTDVSFNASNSVTSKPVERGSNLLDHFVKEPIKISLSGVIGERMLNLKVDLLNFVTNYLRALFPEITATIDKSLQLFRATGIDTLGGSRIDSVMTQLLDWRDRGVELQLRNVEVGSALAVNLNNSSFLIESVEFKQEKGYGTDRVDFELELIEVIFADFTATTTSKGVQETQTDELFPANEEALREAQT